MAGLAPAFRVGSIASEPAVQAVIAAADRLLAGEWEQFHIPLTGFGAEPDWFRDPVSGKRAPADIYAFNAPYRDESKVGNIKYIWELSRHQATTLLAAAWWLTGRAEYAERVKSHLESWWRDNPFLQGVHWVSGIEIGIRLLSWTWMRALLDGWGGCRALFDDNPAFSTQLYHHQRYLRVFFSHGSSANNHLIAELAGLATAAVAFPWFAESSEWAAWARRRLVEEAEAQTHPDGFNREQAAEYHFFVFELLLVSSLAARLAGQPFPAALDASLTRQADAFAASLDAAGNPPRYGDGDEGRGLLVDAPSARSSDLLLGPAGALYGPAPWWPRAADTIIGRITGLVAGPPPPLRDMNRPSIFPDVGMAVLRAREGEDEIWVRCDHGPLGFLSIAAHGHADALSVEVRLGGVEIFSDPGTYCYHGEPVWRSYFKSTAGHNTLTLDGVDQAVTGGPFLWLTQPEARLIRADIRPDAAVQVWEASHDGYRRLKDPVTHRRTVSLDANAATVEIEDRIEAGASHDALLSFHFGPSIAVELDGPAARLAWRSGQIEHRARLDLPAALSWTLHRGETEPPLGWYSAGFSQRQPSWVLTGHGALDSQTRLITRLAL